MMKIKIKLRDMYSLVSPSQIKSGDKVYCHTSVIMNTSGIIAFQETKCYVVNSVSKYEFTLTNEQGNKNHYFQFMDAYRWFSVGRHKYEN